MDEDLQAFVIYNQIKRFGPDFINQYAIENYQKGILRKRVAALLLRGSLIDFGGGSLYNSHKPYLITIMNQLGKESFMYEDDLKLFQSKSDKITVYRGGQDIKTDAMFWTMTKRVAILFAMKKRLNYVLTGEIDKEKLLFMAEGEGGLVFCSPDYVNDKRKSLLTASDKKQLLGSLRTPIKYLS